MNTKSLRWKLPLTACIIALAFTIINPPFATLGENAKEGKLKLGLDLQGGMHLVLRVKTEVLPEEQREDATEIALEIIRNRIDQFGVSEPKILRQGKDQIVIQLPGISDRERALALVGKTALLQFKLVADVTKLPTDKTSLETSDIVPALDEDGKPLLLENKVLLEGKNISSARSDFGGQWGDRVVLLEFDAEGAKIFGDITSENRGRQLAIILDGVVQSAPVIQEAILSGQAQITGSFSTQEAFDLSIALKAGALPAPIEVLEERTVGPELGKESIEKGMRSILYGGLAVLIFMAIYYLFSGLVANFALALNILLIGAALAYFRGTLTLPGIAGVILTVGMAVDTNVLILERIREEMRLGKSALAAINTGYKKAFS
ncbi:MAG: protein-export membrane protein SecD, partial [Candidatus Omnitrophota bacterium]